MYDLVIQVVNYKTKSYLLDCLANVFNDLKSSKLNYLVTVLDNNSGDDLSELERLYSRKLTSYKSDTNLGFGGGHNLLAKKVQAKYLLLLNPDTKITEPRTIERLFDRLHYFKAQVIGPRLVTGSNNIQQRWDHGELRGIRAWTALNIGRSYWKERRESANAAWVSGAVFLIDKNLFDRLGGFDENFFLYKEEEELCWRIRAEGGKIIYDPTISVFHHAGVSAKKEDHIGASTKYFIQKHFENKASYRIALILSRFFPPQV
ncbi:MAG: glycosyltransferase family 2 protein [Patescibacteria group bacterium]